MENFETLVRQRGGVKSQLTRLSKYLETINENTNLNDGDICQLESRTANLINIWSAFENVQCKIEGLSEEIAEHDQERETFENLYYKLSGIARAIIENYKGNKSSMQTTNLKNVSLPTINLPNFDGSYDKWLSFRDTFNSLIHNNKSIADIQRFHYLRMSLKNEASHVIQSLEVTEENYSIAWDLLNKRYENKRLIIHNHVHSLVNLKTVSRESNFALRELLDNMTKHLRALKNLGEPVDSWNTLIIHLLLDKLDHSSKRDWEASLADDMTTMPTFDDFSKFLTKKCNLLEALHPNMNKHISKSLAKTTNTFVTLYKQLCTFCSLPHFVTQCSLLSKLSINDRITQVKNKQLCLNCLRKGHTVASCMSKSSCKNCNKRHHTLLHFETKTVMPTTEPAPSTSQVSLNYHYSANNNLSQILLSTACVLVKDQTQRWNKCRVLLDSGSQSNFVTNEFCKRLNISTTPIQSAVLGINQASFNLTQKADITFRSMYNHFEAKVDCLIISKITENIPNVTFDASSLNIDNNIKLADPTFNEKGAIDMLLGASIFWHLLCIGQIKLGKDGENQPLLHKTRLGWILSGPLTLDTTRQSSSSVCNISINIDNQLEKFWALEECNSRNKYMSTQEQECEQHFLATTTRDSTGRFVVSLPFKPEIINLGDSRSTAIKRFYATEKRLIQNKSLQSEYVAFMQEYQQLGHMKPVNENKDKTSNKVYYFPHHAVIKQSSTSTRTRVVFDGSAKTSTGLSINNVQKVGPVVQNDLFTILLRFRRHPYALTADIEKMYRQIILSAPDRKYHRIFWRSQSNNNLQCFELQTVTYGTASAAFLATRCLKQLAYENRSQYSSSCDVIMNDFYVDDLVTGAESLEKLQILKNEISSILNSARFNLRKWRSNHPALLDGFDTDELFQLDADETKTLGILWNANTDVFKYHITNLKNTSFTKRVILSMTAKIFDPLGLLGPIIIIAKLIMQEIWRYRLSWDESIPHELHYKWINFLNDLTRLNSISIPRYVLTLNAISVQCHGFADSSEKAYGACIYARTIDVTGATKVELICAKSRVAPLRAITLPRLELCAALLLANLVSKIKDVSSIQFDSFYFWSDSTITLHWIKSQPSKWQTFVANRVSEIQTVSEPQEWYHVRSADNPADLLSRGTTAPNLLKSSLWWHGPNWLSHDCSEWPVQPSILNLGNDNISELKKNVTLSVTTDTSDLFTKFSTLTKLQRITAWCYRFSLNCQKPINDRQYGVLSTHELNAAIVSLITVAQQQSFPTELRNLSNGNSSKIKGQLASLNPFVDTNGILRVGGRIKSTNFNFNKKHPIILPKNHILTDLIIRHEHIKLLHSGTQTVLYSLRERYWPISGRNLIRKIIQGCVTCFKVNPQNTNYTMGHLPSHRLLSGGVFETCGVDYAGPFLIKEKKHRNTKFTKAYICLFICFATKAVHLELVSELTTDAFLATLRRFIARRGKPHTIHSDNGTNFVGANRKLDELTQFLNLASTENRISQSLSEEGITWRFNPPYSPHFGGLWEAGIKSAKSHLKRVVGNASLCFEDFYTMLTQIEAILNSRPLSPLSNDPNDLNPLTPGHFLIGKALTSAPDPVVVNVPESRLDRFQRLQKLTQHFWIRWNKEYVSELQTRTKWNQTFPEKLTVGSLVLLREQNQPPMRWKLGRVLQQHPGEDGIVRVITVRTADAIVKRAVRQVCVLPIPPSE